MLTSGSKIGGFLIGDLLGKGAMGEVYKGEQLSLKRPVAIKRIATHLLENEDMVRRFKREAQVLAKVGHPNVVGVIECEEFADAQGEKHLLLIMELIEGGRSLKAHLGKPIDWRLSAAVIRMCADGLAAAFDHQVVHRDIKPDNIMLTHKGIAKLVDFGLAKAAESTALTMQAAPMGTPLFMSPEACRGEEIGHAGDLYSLGVSWWFMLTGQYPFQAANLHGLLFKHISDPLPPPTGLFDHVPEPIVKLVYQCLEKDPAKRPASAMKLVEAIEALPAQGLLIPRDARELIGAGSHNQSIGGGTTAATAVAGKIDRTAATIIGGAQQAATAAPPAARTMAADLSPQGAVAATVVSNLNSAQPASAAPAPAAAPTEAKKSGGGIAIAVVAVVVILGAAGAWFALRPAPSAPTPDPKPTAAVAPPKPAPTPTPAGTTVTPKPTGSDAPLPNATTPPVAEQPKPVMEPAPATKPVEPAKPAEDAKPVVAAAVAPPAEPPKPTEAPKPVEQPKPADPAPAAEPPKPVEQPKAAEPPKPVEQPKPEVPKPIDTSAFDSALAGRDWSGAKKAADALPEPARTDAQQRLTKAANAQLIATMRAAQPLYKDGKYAESAAVLAKEMGTVDFADKQVRDTFITLAKNIRQAAKEAEENP